MSENKNKIHNVWDRFILKKDLPTWKEWEEFWIWEDGCLYGTTKDWDVIMVYHVSTLLNFNILNSEWFEKIEKEKSNKESVFDLEETDMFFSIDREGYIQKIDLFWISTLKTLQDIWNVFLTEEEAEAELERRKALQRIKKFMWENLIENVEFKSCNVCRIFYDEDKGFWVWWAEYDCWDILWFFETEEDCKKIINNCEDDLKIIYNIKD